MTPAAIFNTVRDGILILLAIWLVWFVMAYGKDTVKVNDMKALEVQVKRNADMQAIWRKEQEDADTQHDLDVAAITATVAAQQHPVYILHRSPGACPLPATPAEAARSVAKDRGSDQGSGVDLRPQINAFERKYETALADCRGALEKWPH